MNNVNIFSTEVAPALVLLDLEGKRHPVAAADQAGEALRIANELYGLGGQARTRCYADATANEPLESILLFYSSESGRPTKGEISHVARIVAHSNGVKLGRIRMGQMSEDGPNSRVTGGRAVVYAERATIKNGSVPFLVSTRIWYNRNRSTVNFPQSIEQIELVLEDINDRLKGVGSVSLAR
ncbi:hypothetical protein KUV57_13585 [Epibacterium sp. DP7N7-1]|nr:hypothetical protein [Epibacterium sp. DP7N7-1]